MKKIIQFNSIVFTVTILCLSFFECRKNVDDPINGSEFPTLIESGVFGRIEDPSGKPAENVAISFDKTTVFTDKNGVFILRNQLMNNQGAQIKIKKAGFFELYKTVVPIKGKLVNLQARLVTRRVTSTINSSQGGTVISNGNASVKFASNSFQTSNSSPYTGKVNVYTYYLDPESKTMEAEMPGNLTGRDKDGRFVVLRTMGMLNVELEDQNGNPLNLNPQIPAEITIPIPTSLSNKASSSIPLWHFNATKGGWIEEGVASRVGDKYEGKVSHFTTWNWDFRFISVELKFRLIDQSGNPLANTYFDIDDLTNLGHGSGSTNNDGTFKGYIPENSSFDLKAGCNFEVIKNFTSTTTNLDLGDIQVKSFKTIQLIANLKDCNSNPVVNGYLIVRDASNNSIFLVTQVNKGVLDLIMSYCSPSSYTYKFYDLDNKKESSEASFSITNETIKDFGSVSICDNRIEFLDLTIDGQSIPSLPTQTFDSLGYSINSFGLGQDSSTYLVVLLPSLNIGSQTPINFYYYGHPKWTELSCSLPNCTGVSFTITQSGPIGTNITGTFTGDLLNSVNNQITHFNGVFSFKRKY